MNRKEILKMYDVNEMGIIVSPGKFEGEMLYVPYFYDLVLNAGGDCESVYASDQEFFSDKYDPDTQDDYIIGDRLYVEPEDIEMFPELNGFNEVILRYDDNGFVYGFASGNGCL